MKSRASVSMAAALTNREIADVFYAISDTMEILGEDAFRARAYRRAGDVIVDLAAPLAALRQRGELTSVPGIGKVIADKIGELLDTGQLQFYERMRAKVPAGVLELLRVPNIGPRTAGRRSATPTRTPLRKWRSSTTALSKTSVTCAKS